MKLRAILWAATVMSATACADNSGTPFAPKSQPDSDTLFTRISPEHSGIRIENRFDDSKMWGTLYYEFQGGAVGTGLAAGDVDGDGWVDLYVVSKTSSNKLYRQVAPFEFEDVTEKAGVPGGETWGTGASFADVDNDGDLDLYVCQFKAPNLLYINDGNGVFAEAGARAGLDIVSGSVIGAFEDYDRDGDLDVYILTNIMDATMSPEGEPDYLYRNRGDGTFENATAAAGLKSDMAKGHSATWWDADGDGWSDLYVSNDFEAPDHLYKNNGDGTFSEITDTALPHTAWYSMGADYGDIDNDGRFDFLVADMASTTHFKSKVTMGDMGGWVDTFDTQSTPQYMKNAVFLNTGTHRFMEVAKLTGLSKTDWTWSTRFEDFDNDGWLDLHVTNGMARSFTDSDMINRIKRLQSPRQIIALVKSSPVLRESNLAFRNDGKDALHFSKVTKEWGLEHEGVSFGSVSADFDNDGDLDLAYSNFEESVSLYRNDSQANSIVLSLEGRKSNRFGVGARIALESSHGAQVRKITVSRGVLSSSQPIAHFGLGADTKVASLKIHWPSGVEQSLSHLEANRHYRITEPKSKATPAEANPIRSEVEGLFANEAAQRGLGFHRAERVFDDMSRQPLLPYRMNALGGGIAVGDSDGDGDMDIYFSGAAGQSGSLYLKDEKGAYHLDTREQPWQKETTVEEMAPLWVDANLDGKLDLYVSAGSVEVEEGDPLLADRLYLNTGNGVFEEIDSALFDPGSISASVVTSADYDRDGDLDLFVGGRVIPGQYPKAPRSLLLENREGRLIDASDEVAEGLSLPGMVTAAIWSDVDQDSWPDLLLLSELDSPRLFKNEEGRLAEATIASGLSEYKGWWQALTAADVDNDGDLDYVAMNLGLNTKYKATADHPFTIFYNDFEGEGRCNIVEAKYEGDSLLPERGRSCSSRAMPSLAAKFPTFRDFGVAALDSVYNAEKLDASLTMEATELGHGVFINDGSGRFSFKRLPRIAQASPVFGISATDFNGDGNVDLALAQNFSGPQVETGRYNGGVGLLLIGDGNGDFTALGPRESGILIEDEARGLATIDLNDDGWADVLASRPNNSALAYVNQTAQRGNSVSIVLETDMIGNRAGIGAQLLVRFEDGSKQVFEINSGTGYLSQSEAAAFVGYLPENPPSSVEVTWPDGRRSSVPFSSSGPRMRIASPAR